jgi:hypothetical protein
MFAHCVLYHHKKPTSKPAPVKKMKRANAAKNAPISKVVTTTSDNNELSNDVLDSGSMFNKIVAMTPSDNNELSDDVVDSIAAMTPSDNNELSDDVDRDSMLNEIFDLQETEDHAVACNVTTEVTSLPRSEATDLHMFAEDHRSASCSS